VRRYLLRALRVQISGGRVLFGLTVLGVALGVASVFSIQILNRSSLAAFAGGMQAVSGEADLSVLGRQPTFAESLYPEALQVAGVEAAWPLYRVEAAVSARPGLLLEIVGFDLFAPVRLPVAGTTGGEASSAEIAPALSRPGWAAVTPALAAELGWEVGDAVEVTSGGHRARLVIGALVDFQKLSPLASRRLVVMDIAQAQGLLGAAGQIHQIDIRIRAGADREGVATALARRLGPGVRVVTPEQRQQETGQLLGAFRLNLTALSLISLFVGLFLVHTSVQAALVRRRTEFGVLRSLGATRGQVLGLILAEACVLGLLGVAVGLPLGYGAAAANVDLVSRTVSNLYLLDTIEQLDVPVWLFLLSAAVGVAGAAAGALLPALDMSRRDPRALLAAYTLHERADRFARPACVAGIATLLAAWSWFLLWGSGWRPAGFVLAFALVVALPLLAPLAVVQVARHAPRRGFGLAYALRGLATRLQGSAFAVAALAVAVSMLVGITLMVGSFRATVGEWIGQTVHADLYLSAESWARADDAATLDPAFVRGLAARREVRQIDRLRRTRSYAGGSQVAVAGIDMTLPAGERRFLFLAGEPREAMRRAANDGAVLVSEPLARRLHLGVGDTLRLDGPAGTLGLPIAAVFADYGNERGSVLMDLGTLARHFGPGEAHSVAVYLADGLDPEQAADALRTAFPDAPVRYRSNRRLREEVLRIFDQTFAVTRLLQGMALAVAACGVMLTLLVLARERAAEIALYRALGSRRGQILRIFLGKGIGLGAIGLALGLPAGVALAFVLVKVINPAYFGWTIPLRWAWGDLTQQVATILAAAAAAALYPAARASATPATELNREEVA